MKKIQTQWGLIDKCPDPVLLGHYYNQEFVQVWCPFCKALHQHVMDSNIKEGKPSLKEAHCGSGPFLKSGYYIAIDFDKGQIL